MELTVSLDGLPFSVSPRLISLLNAELLSKGLTPTGSDVIFNFRDKTYSPESGGYHPVEIRLCKEQDGWRFDYITDFCYVGGPYPELAKDLDFNFTEKCGYLLYSGYCKAEDCDELYKLWQQNFISYYWDGVFDEIEISL